MTDEAGLEEHGISQAAFLGLQEAKARLGIDFQFLESVAPTDFEPNIEALLARDCDVIVASGSGLAEAARLAAESNPDRTFVIVGFEFDPPLRNVVRLRFDIAQPAFLAGYLAAALTTTGRVGAFGDINIAPVTAALDGFWTGIAHYNLEHRTDVRLLGWDPAAPDEGVFVGVGRQRRERQVTEGLVEDGADIIMPVATAGGVGAAQAVRDAPGVVLVWFGTDGCLTAGEFCDLIVTSVLRNVDAAVFEIVERFVTGPGHAGVFVGTLDNGGVGLAPFHEFEDEVPARLGTELAEVRQGIADGSISIDPADYR